MNTNSDLKSYRPLLCRVAGYSTRSDFDQIFKSVLEKSGVDKNTSFLLKMELHRLQRPCRTPVDLRGLVDGECEEHIHEGVLHYFDEIAKAVYEEQIKNFNGYTIGVYESVTNTINNYRVMHEKEKRGIKVDIDQIKKKKIAAKKYFETITFNNFHTRKEERMHYVSDIYLIDRGVDKYIGRSIDISVSGCQIKAKKDFMPEKGRVIELLFRKLKEEFELSLKGHLKYEVVGIDVCESDEDFNIIRLKRVPCEATIKFDQFLANYIIGNKRRYKINLDNTIDSIYSRGYSQYSLPRRSDLNVFVRNEVDSFMAIATESNRETMEFWKDSADNLFIHNLLNKEKMRALIDKLNNGASNSYLYVFKGLNKNKECVFYAAFEEDFNSNSSLKESFCKLGIDKYTFKVFNVTVSKTSSEFAYQPFSLTSNEIEVFRRLNKRPSARTMNKFDGLSHIVSIRDITTEGSKEDYLNKADIEYQVDKLRVFKLDRVHEQIAVAPIKAVDIRKENRYKINTSALVDINKLSLEGKTVDLSTKGLKVKLNEPSELSKGDIVSISLPEYNLKALKYSIVNINNDLDEICLVVHGDVIEHKGRIFLRNLFNKNKNNLVDYQIGDNNEEISYCIQNILSTSATNLSAYLHRQGVRSLIRKVSFGSEKMDIIDKLMNENMIELGFLQKENIYRAIIKDKLSAGNGSNASASENIYISIHKDEIKAVSEKELGTKEDRVEFIKTAMSKGSFYCLNSSFARAGRPDMSKIGIELNYISVYAMHKGKEIEDELWSINGIIDLKDITSEVVSRCLGKSHIH